MDKSPSLKCIQIAQYGLFKLTPNALANIPTAQTTEQKGFTKGLKKTSSKAIVIVNPEKLEMYTTTAVVDKNTVYISLFPDPIHIFFNQAYISYQCAQFSKEQFDSKVFSRSTELNLIHEDMYHTYISYRSSTIIFLYTAIEAFINSIIPDDYIYEKSTEDGVKNLNKSEIERHVSTFDKINHIIPAITNINLKIDQQKIYSSIKSLKRQRDILIHLKTARDKKNMETFMSQFGNILNDDHTVLIDAVKDFMNLITKDYIKME